jgi:predicted phage terminase large subunit-like protein
VQGEFWFASQYQQRPVPLEGGIFKESWLRYYDPDPDHGGMPKQFDLVLQSWDPTVSKSSHSDFCVGQVWGRKGSSFYLLDQVRGRWDFDETVAQIRALSKEWPEANAKVIEAQAIGAGLSTHLKNLGIPGLIPIPAVGQKEARALTVSPYFQAHDVYIPLPESRPWVVDYISELTNFPNATHDDCVDATSQALLRLKGTLYDLEMEGVITDTREGAILTENDYRIAWIPARANEYGVIVVYNVDHNSIVFFERIKWESMQQQIEKVYIVAQRYEAAVRAQAGADESMLQVLERRGTYVRRIDMKPNDWQLAYENLSLLISYKQIKLPNNPELLAELEVFKSEPRLDGKPDYSSQAGQNSAVRALCLLTHDIHPLESDFYDEKYDDGGEYSEFYDDEY